MPPRKKLKPTTTIEDVVPKMFKLNCPTRKEVRDTALKQRKKFVNKENHIALLVTDDFVRAALIDPVVGFCCNKSYVNYKTIPEKAKLTIKEILKANVICNNEIETAKTIAQILKQYHDHEQLEVIIQNYLQLFNIHSGVTLDLCYDYSSEQNLGLKLISTRNWEAGDLLNLHNFSSLFYGTPQEVNTYSTALSLPKRSKDIFWLGPSALVNHSCDPNAEFVSFNQKTLIKILRPIGIREEICVDYGPKYFENISRECECPPCNSKSTPGQAESQIGIKKRQDMQDTLTSSDEDSTSSCRVLRERPESKIPPKVPLGEVLSIYENLFHGTNYPPELENECGQKLALIKNEVTFLDKQSLSERFCKLNPAGQKFDQEHGSNDRCIVGFNDSKAQFLKDLVKMSELISSIGTGVLGNTDPYTTYEQMTELRELFRNSSEKYRAGERKEHIKQNLIDAKERSHRQNLATLGMWNDTTMLQRKDVERNTDPMELFSDATQQTCPLARMLVNETGAEKLEPAYQVLVCKALGLPSEEIFKCDTPPPKPRLKIRIFYDGMNDDIHYSAAATSDEDTILRNSCTASSTSSMEPEPVMEKLKITRKRKTRFHHMEVNDDQTDYEASYPEKRKKRKKTQRRVKTASRRIRRLVSNSTTDYTREIGDTSVFANTTYMNSDSGSKPYLVETERKLVTPRKKKNSLEIEHKQPITITPVEPYYSDPPSHTFSEDSLDQYVNPGILNSKEAW